MVIFAMRNKKVLERVKIKEHLAIVQSNEQKSVPHLSLKLAWLDALE